MKLFASNTKSTEFPKISKTKKLSKKYAINYKSYFYTDV